MSIMALQGPLREANIAFDSWREEMDIRGRKVEQFRRYRDGDFDANLTAEMRRLLRVRPNPDNSNEFGINYCETVVSTYVDRLNIQALSSDDEAAEAYVQDAMRRNRFDGLQLDVHDMAATDGDAFVLVYWDEAKGRVKWSLEPAFDGTTGMVPVYSRDDKSEMFAAVKFWRESQRTFADTIRINIYFEDRIERYQGGVSAGSISRLDVQPNPVGICPVVPFSNRGRGNMPYGLSELESVIPLQDSLNRTLHSMIMASELSAFQIRYVIGTKAPQALTPGMFVDIYAQGDNGNAVPPDEQGIAWLNSIRFGSFDQGEIAPYLNQARFLIEQIHDVSSTPRRGSLSSNASGEALKQDEIGLISKVRRAQTKFGNSWERVAELTVATGNTYDNARLSGDAEFFCEWRDAEVRNDAVTLDMALKVVDLFGRDKGIELAAKAFDLSPEQVDEIKAGAAVQETRRLQQMAMMGVNGFGQEPGGGNANGNGNG